jgi:hypothetical protein
MEQRELTPKEVKKKFDDLKQKFDENPSQLSLEELVELMVLTEKI